MKAVVVEFKSDLAAVLSDDGCIVTVKNDNYEIGQIIQMRNSKIDFTKKIAMFAASAAAFVVLGVGSWAYASPYSYVSIDVNPSIEFTVNRFDRVLHVKAVNDDGEEILKEISLGYLNNKTIEEALTKTVKQLSASGYFEGDIEGGIVITTSGQNPLKAEELSLELQQTAKNEVVENGDDVDVEVFSVPLERVEEARSLGVTPGKLNLVEKLQASATDPATIDLEEWLSKSVKDIMKATKDNRKGSTDTGSANIIDVEDDDKSKTTAEKDDKEIEKEEDKTSEETKEHANKAKNYAEKAKDYSEKARDYAEKAAEKAITATDKATAAEEYAAEKASDAKKKAYNADKSRAKDKDKADKAAEDAKKDAKKANEEAWKSKEKAKKATEEADKAADEANEAANEADKAADEAGNEADEVASDEADKAVRQAEKDNNKVTEGTANNRDDSNHGSNNDTENATGNDRE
ncbi:MAG: anti-sigma-I factor RsgI family protein [Mobilitalea sp.]